MVRKSTPAEKAARMLDLVPYISSHQGISFQSLASEFGISESELLSDLNALWMCGDSRFDLIELEFESGFVSIRNADTLNLVRSLSSQEIVAILLGLELLAKNIPTDRIDLLRTIATLSTKLGKGLEKIVEAVPAISTETTSVIESAFKSSRRISIDYYTASEDRVTTRVVSPLEMYQSENREFLVGFCELTQSQRTFRIDRIKKISLLDQQVMDIDLAKIPTASITAKVSLIRELRKSLETLGCQPQGNESDVEFSTFSPAWLTRTVIASGGAMVLTEPSSVRNEISARAKSALDLYD